MSRFETLDELKAAGGVRVHCASGPTWNDGGRWNTWVYLMPNGEHLKVHQETDYREDVEITRVRPVVETKIVYEDF